MREVAGVVADGEECSFRVCDKRERASERGERVLEARRAIQPEESVTRGL